MRTIQAAEKTARALPPAPSLPPALRRIETEDVHDALPRAFLASLAAPMRPAVRGLPSPASASVAPRVAPPRGYQRASKMQAGAPQASQAVSTTREAGCTSARNSPWKVAA